MRKKSKKLDHARIVLRLPDLDHSKTSVLNSLSPPRSRRNYRFAMDQFIAWYCSEPRLALNRTVVLRFRLISSHWAGRSHHQSKARSGAATGLRSCGSGLLSPDLAAGIRRVKGVKQLGQRSGNWLNLEQCQILLEKSDGESLRNSRDLAISQFCWVVGTRPGKPCKASTESCELHNRCSEVPSGERAQR